jgi:hypothetical protein
MKVSRKLKIALLTAGIVGLSELPIPVVHVTTAKAIIGRPLTPVSVAGVARRTARRSYYYNGYYY